MTSYKISKIIIQIKIQNVYFYQFLKVDVNW